MTCSLWNTISGSIDLPDGKTSEKAVLQGWPFLLMIKKMKRKGILIVVCALIAGCAEKKSTDPAQPETICNPLNLSYRFQPDRPSRREAADPAVILYRDTYYLFASKSGGYWYSDNLADWVFLETDEIPTEEYAPTAIAIGDIVYFLASSRVKSTIYRTEDPLSGHWEIALDSLEVPVWDPAFFLDDDQRLYLYWGCSNFAPIMGVEVDYRNHFRFIGTPVELIFSHPEEYGWEVPGDYNSRKGQAPWIEGAWLNKHNGRYYLQYAGPGTEFKSYCDGVYISDNPLGPYELQPHNPFAYKPGGFSAGAGHGSTFQDKYGNWWHIGTMTISQKHMFERRLGLFPAFFDDTGILYADTRFGDYPLIIPGKKFRTTEDLFPGWMLLSHNKDVEVSSFIDTLPPFQMTDEDIRTYWAAKTGSGDEWASLDLGKLYDVYAIQINFAEHQTEIFGRQDSLCYQYVIEYSGDNTGREILVDRSGNREDNPHDYIQLPHKVSCRYLRLKALRIPGGHLALSGFRVFGKGNGESPQAVSQVIARRNPDDRRSVTLQWTPSPDATGYNIRFGTGKDRLYHDYITYGDSSVVINSLNAGWNYYFSIDAFNGNGVTPGRSIVRSD
jgi:xylan 1,4-beta-xylosidase